MLHQADVAALNLAETKLNSCSFPTNTHIQVEVCRAPTCSVIFTVIITEPADVFCGEMEIGFVEGYFILSAMCLLVLDSGLPGVYAWILVELVLCVIILHCCAGCTTAY